MTITIKYFIQMKCRAIPIIMLDDELADTFKIVDVMVVPYSVNVLDVSLKCLSLSI